MTLRLGRLRRVILFAAVGALVVSIVAAKEVPFLTGRVMDLAGLIPDDIERRVEQTLAAYEERTGSQVVVLTIFSLDGDNLEEYSHRAAESWGLGRAEVDDGVLLLVVKDERKLRIEVGYGAEPVLTDLRSRRILDQVITPRFRAGDFGGGIEAGVEAILATLDGQELPAPAPRRDPTTEFSPLAGCLTMFLVLFLFLVFVAMLRALRRSRPSSWTPGRGMGGFPVIIDSGRGGRGGGWTFGSGGGGFGGGFSGGGGSFGGGGASGGW